MRQVKGTVVMKPKKLVDADDVLTPGEAAIVQKGEAQRYRGEYVTVADLEHDLDHPAVTRRLRVRAESTFLHTFVRCPSLFVCGIINHELNPSNCGFPHP